ncbi:MAG: AI-2E family transporter [Halobacteriales archaeon]|nr:AI-2E family transporter [Halobacteriales archaeon]
MTPTRTNVLAGLLVAVILIAGLILSGVLSTVFFAVTIAYVMSPIHRQLVNRGFSSWMASAIATTLVFVGILGFFVPIGLILYSRRRMLLDLIATLPESIRIELFGFSYLLTATEFLNMATGWLSQVAVQIARTAPILAIKATLFALVVFALLLRGRQVGLALLAPIPTQYHDIADALHERSRGTLYALYIIQAATAVGTFLIAFPVFAALGYRTPIALATIAAIFQFLPIIGPSVVVVLLAGYQLTLGDYTGAIVLLVVGTVLIGFLPDAIIRPRLARETGQLPASLYFVGFTGGLLSLGFVGIIAGPLVVAILSELLSLLSDEINDNAIKEFQR